MGPCPKYLHWPKPQQRSAAEPYMTTAKPYRIKPAEEADMASRSSLAEQSAIPIITCPSCGSHLRLSTIMPDGDHRERMTFACACGFDYRQTRKLGDARQR